MSNRRSPIYLITGLILGIALGIAYGWIWTPVDTLEAYPKDLRSDFKDSYRELIARAYQANQDLGRASQRLALLGDEDPARALALQAQLTLGQGGSSEVASALGALAAALQDGPGTALAANNTTIEPGASPDASPTNTIAVDSTNPVPSETPTQQTTAQPTNTPGASEAAGTQDSAERTPQPSLTPTVTPTPTATQGPPFVLLDIPLECNPNIDPPLIQVYVFDGAGNPVPGVAVIVSWDNNQTSRFVTGLKPEYGLGYADFTMDPQVTYSLRLEAGGDPINSITGRLCEDQDEPYWGSWRLNFVQP
ncbi:MAG TPA: hypothetical protein VLA32_02940 [Anaerolineales bacterium]|jgi:hypothetical protein|nr:hypothetical protein [Anaerolineales bacterium]